MIFEAVTISCILLVTFVLWSIVRVYRELETRVDNLEAMQNRSCERKSHARIVP